MHKPHAGSSDYVPQEVLREAQHWSKYAVAAYGKGGYTWNTPKSVGAPKAAAHLRAVSVLGSLRPVLHLLCLPSWQH